ncbi:MAG: hypothetical protein ACI9JO_001102 [Psychrobacter okhotskensis]|jgi:hypothetical protein|nr:DUF2931 family protein [Psychrobacter immobilis]
MNEQKTPWETFIFAPRHYPVELVAGESFWMYDNGARIGFTAHANGGWRSAGAQAGGGSMLPDGINLTWLSPTEGKYYHVRARIPKEIILREFNRKLSMDIENKLKTEKFKEIHFALAPGGFVSMRLGWAQVEEVAQFQAKEVDISWEYFAEANHFNPEGLSEEKYLAGFTDKLPEHIQVQRADGTVPYDRWKAFNTQKFPWHLATTLDLHGYTEFLINGNMSFIAKPELDLSVYTDKQTVPAWYRIYFKREGKRYRGNIIVTQNDPDQREQPEGDVEIFNIFRQYFAEDKRPAALVIDIIDGQIVAYLDNGITKRDLPLYDSDYRVLKDDEYPWFK